MKQVLLDTVILTCIALQGAATWRI